MNGEFISWVKVGNKSLNGNERNVLLRNLGGAVPELVSAGYVAGVDRIEDCRGVGVVDIEGDGDLDLVVQGVEKPSMLLVNQGPVGNYLQVRLRGTVSNRDAIGARVEVRVGSRTIVREISSTAGFISGQSLMAHFGLGTADRCEELVVHWPRGAVTRLHDVPVNQRLVLVEPARGAPAESGGKR